MPTGRVEQQDWFEPYYGSIDRKSQKHFENVAKNLKRGLIYGNPHSVIGLFRSCLDIAANGSNGVDGVFSAVRDKFDFPGSGKLLERITSINDFRNTYVAHTNKELNDKDEAEENLKFWVETLTLLRI